MDALEWVLSGFFSQTPSWFWDAGGGETLSGIVCPGKFYFVLFGYVWVFGIPEGVSGTVTRSPGRKIRKPFTAAAELLEYHPLTSTVRKLKLNSQEQGAPAQRPQKRRRGR